MKRQDAREAELRRDFGGDVGWSDLFGRLRARMSGVARRLAPYANGTKRPRANIDNTASERSNTSPDRQAVEEPVRRTRFRGVHLKWPMVRAARTFRMHVVQPRAFEADYHDRIFRSVLQHLIAPKQAPVDPYGRYECVRAPIPFDLVCFPEAFLSSSALVQFLASPGRYGPHGCVHVGLRSDSGADTHLFTVRELESLVGSLRQTGADETDLASFSSWVASRHEGEFFNVGCLFARDASARLRVCLHPKVVRSRFESGFDRHMAEADFLTLVTVEPTDQTLLSTTIQPLICSDVLQLETDRPDSRPLEAVSADAGCFGAGAPQHVDVVSVTTFSPQSPSGSGPSRGVQWHWRFREAFVRAAREDALRRHHYAAFILANFGSFPSTPPRKEAGLSGIFYPRPLDAEEYPGTVVLAAYGRAKDGAQGEEDSWLTDDQLRSSGPWSSLGHIVALSSRGAPEGSRATILGLTLNRLPRDAASWQRPMPAISLVTVSDSTEDNSGGLSFTLRGNK